MDVHSRCRFCEHSNPAEAKYCVECGGCLYLVPCSRCGAVNDVKERTCYRCRGQVQPGKVDSIERPSSVVVITKPNSPNILSRALEIGALEPMYPGPPTRKVAKSAFKRHLRVLTGTAVLVVIAIAGYFGYRQHALVNAVQPSDADGARSSPASAGVIRGNAETQPAGTITSANLAGAGRPNAEAKGAVKAPTAQAATKGSAGNNAAVACAESAATLGLCQATAGPKKVADPAAAIKAVKPRAEVAVPRKAGEPDTPRQESCSDAAAALGLCVAAPAVPTPPAVTHTQTRE